MITLLPTDRGQLSAGSAAGLDLLISAAGAMVGERGEPGNWAGRQLAHGAVRVGGCRFTRIPYWRRSALGQALSLGACLRPSLAATRPTGISSGPTCAS